MPKLGQNRGNAGKGRPKGVPNKTTAALKDMILTALHGAHEEGAIAYLIEQAEKNPVAFMGLVGKVLPLQMDHDVSKRLAKALAWKPPT